MFKKKKNKKKFKQYQTYIQTNFHHKTGCINDFLISVTLCLKV